MPRFTPDLAWFKANPLTNFRLRDAQPGEVDELADKALDAFIAGAEFDGGLRVPDRHKPRILAIKLPLRRVARMLTFAADPAPDSLAVMAVAFGARLAID